MEDSEISVQATGRSYNYGLGYLRAFCVLLVLVHHAVLAYHPFAPPIPEDMPASRWWLAFPVVDDGRSVLIAYFTGFNDTFLMATLFFVSGLFVWGSLKRKGVARFLVDRTVRLGIPFIVVALLIAPLAYFPSYLLSGGPGNVAGFWSMWLSLGNWPAGHGWFIWLLLAFGAVAAGGWHWVPAWGFSLGDAVQKIERPRTLFLVLVGVSWIAYVSMDIGYPPGHWTTIGPFSFQSNRLLYYFVYFGFGVAFGASGLQTTILAGTGALARSWTSWVFAGVVAYALVLALSNLDGGGSLRVLWDALGGLAFVTSTAASCLMLLALFTRFTSGASRIWDSLDRNAYGMYVIHYPLASAAMYLLLDLRAPVLVKALMAGIGTVAVTWATTALLRRIPLVAKVL